MVEVKRPVRNVGPSGWLIAPLGSVHRRCPFSSSFSTFQSRVWRVALENEEGEGSCWISLEKHREWGRLSA